MSKYKLHISRKTALLNALRSLFLSLRMEKLLLKWQKSNLLFAHKFIPPNYLYPKGSHRLAYFHGIPLQVDISDVVGHFLYWNLVNDDYKHITEKIAQGRIIFDIGANIGSTSLYFSKLSPDATIFAFEPNQETFSKLQSNLSFNRNSRILPQNIGLGDKNSVMKLFEVDENNPGMNRILPDGSQFPFTTIQIERLDDFCKRHEINKIDFMKIDVEGFEYAVLEGGQNIIKSCKPLIFLELDDSNLRDNNRSARELLILLEGMGYTCFKRADNSTPITADMDLRNCHFDLITS